MTPRRERLLCVTRTEGYGGTERHLLEFLERVPPESVEATILCLGDDPYSSRVGHLPATAEVYSSRKRRTFSHFRSHFRSARPDVIIFVNGCHGLFPWQAYAAARLSGARRVCAIEHLIAAPAASSARRRGGLSEWLRTSAPGRLVDATVCVSEAVRRRLVREYGYPPARTSAVHNGVNLAHFKPGAEDRDLVRRRLGIAGDEVIAVCVARLAPEKGIDVLLRAVASLRARGVSFRCWLVGDGPDGAALQHQAQESEVSGQVQFLGFQSDVRSFLRAADLFVLPSFKEGLPLVLLEAMACGLPCVATDVGGSAEAVLHGETGIVVEAGDDDGLSVAIGTLVTDHDLRRAMGREADARVRAHFDVARTMAEIRRELLGRDDRAVEAARR